MTKFIDIVFDGPPGPNPGRFVEVENESGESICAGEWIDRGDGMWALRIQEPPQWLPITTVPSEGKFLVYMPDEMREPIQAANWHPNMKVTGGVFAFDLPEATHWMPMPPPPEPQP